MNALPLSAQAAISSAFGGSRGAFAARRSVGGWELSGGGVRASIRGGAVGVSARGGSLVMGLAAIGRGTQMQGLRAPRISARGNRVAIDRGEAREWYAAGPLGIEQGFTVGRRPVGGRGPLKLAVRVAGFASATATGSSVRWLTPAGRVWLRIGGLVAVDRAGRRLSARLQLRGRTLIMSVDDSWARYPVRIDPLIQQGGKLTANDEDTSGFFGASVALPADGNTALIGGPDDQFSDFGQIGAAWVFTRSAAGVWTQQGAKLTPTDESGNGEFGASVALSTDGNTALIGAPFDTGDGSAGAIGAAWVFTRVGGSWVQRGSKLVASDEAPGAQFGDSVALSADGTTALVGGKFDGNGPDSPGAAWVFIPGLRGFLAQQGPKLTPSDSVSFAQFGASVALSSDGNTALIGGPDDNGFVGAAWTFTRSAGVWTQRGTKLAGIGEDGFGNFGASVALSSDGATALIGSPHDDGTGASYVFAGQPGAMTQQAPKLTPTGEVGGAVAGLAVALSSNGATALVGGPFDHDRVGAAWVFTPPAPTCVNVSSRTAAGGGPTSVAVNCTGAPGATLRYSVVTAPTHGSISTIDNANARVSYMPQTGFNGLDSFTYMATDQWGNSSSVATATITVPPATPICRAATAATPPGGGQVTVTLRCTAPPGVALTYAVLAGPSHGSVSAVNQTNGQVNYLAQSGFLGQDSFTYQAVDSGGASQPATARITVPPPPPRPIASIIGPAKVTVGQPVTYSASVIDSIGTPNAYRWTVAGRQIGSGPTLTHVFTRPGLRGLALHVGDSAGDGIDATLDVAAVSPRLRVKLDFHAEFSIPPKDSTFASLIARAVPIGTSIRFACSGPVCPFATKTYHVTGGTTCRGKRCKKPSTSQPNARDVDLTPALGGVSLPIGTVLTITFSKPLTIGQLETLTIGAAGPTSRKACIPVGKTRAASRC